MRVPAWLDRSIMGCTISERSEALEFSRQLGFDPDSRPESITDGRLRAGVSGGGDSRFGGRSADAIRRSRSSGCPILPIGSTRRLRVTFRGYAKATLATIYQKVVVESVAL